LSGLTASLSFLNVLLQGSKLAPINFEFQKILTMKTFTLLCMLLGNLSPSKFSSRLAASNEISSTNRENPHLTKITHSSAIQNALHGYSCLQETNFSVAAEYMIIIDYSLPSTFPRLLVYDLKNQRICSSMHVAHGRGSGLNLAESFSNQPASYKSCLGFFKIGNMYSGAHGRAVRLIGLEPGINDRTLQRGIVIHAADYVELHFINTVGRAGRSLGCPAVSASNLKVLMPYLQKTAHLFIYAPQAAYFQQSRFFR
jgi:hypothetical protein